MTFSRLTIGTNIIATSKDKSVFYDGEFERVLTIKNVKNLIRLIL
jgi:hypothetical protein